MRFKLGAVTIIAMLCVSQIPAQGANIPYKNGLYLAASGSFSTLDGGFDGQTVLSTSTVAIIVPDMNLGFGAGGLIGYRSGNWAVEAGGYYRAYTGFFGINRYDANVVGFTLDAEWLPFTGSAVQPYLLAGFGFSTLTVVDGSVDAFSQVGDAQFYPGGLRVGLGVEFCVTREFFIRAQGT